MGLLPIYFGLGLLLILEFGNAHAQSARHGCTLTAVSFGSQCLTFFSTPDNELSVVDAAAVCVGRGGRLAKLEHPDEVHNYITETYGKNYFWTGGSDALNEGSWVWTNGQPLDARFPWGKHEPNGGTRQNCLRVGGGSGVSFGYDDVECSNKHGYICEGRDSGCVGNAVAIGSQCLTISNENDKLNWNSAVAACATKGKRLAKLKDPVDVYKHVIRYYHNDDPGYENFYVGASDIANEGSWVWIDGQQLDDQFPWRKTGNPEPNGGRGENCLVVAADPNHAYIDAGCGYLFRYICEDVAK